MRIETLLDYRSLGCWADGMMLCVLAPFSRAWGGAWGASAGLWTQKLDFFQRLKDEKELGHLGVDETWSVVDPGQSPVHTPINLATVP